MAMIYLQYRVNYGETHLSNFAQFSCPFLVLKSLIPALIIGKFIQLINFVIVNMFLLYSWVPSNDNIGKCAILISLTSIYRDVCAVIFSM